MPGVRYAGGVDALAEDYAPRPSVDSEEAAEAFFRDAPRTRRSEEVKRNAALFLLHHGYTVGFGFRV